MPIYPIGIQSFSEIIENDYLYVDKTALIHKLLSTGKYYFLSRPRRFGKSLLLSTIEAYFLGRRELFCGLAIDSLADRWEEHPVLHLDLNNREYLSLQDLTDMLNAKLEEWESVYGDEKRDRALEERFAYVIRRAFELTGRQVVVLVDEYDKPMLNAIDDEPLAEAYRSKLKAFYSNLKTLDRYVRFAMLTGVARFSKVSIFSDLNNLRDISFSRDYAAICGISDEELDANFGEGIRELAGQNGMDTVEVRDMLRRNYDGYHFAAGAPGIYNPFSLMNVFAERSFGNYWFATGTPTYLVNLIRRKNWSLAKVADYHIDRSILEQSGVADGNPITTFYQSGYLTIKTYDEEFREYVLDYPNEEVKEGFMKFLLPYYFDETESDSAFAIRNFIIDVRGGDVESFMKRLSAMLAKVPYSADHAARESHFQNAIYLIFTLLGFYVKVEERLSNGRIDLVVETAGLVYVFEFKIDKSARAALEQIKAKDYTAPFLASGKEVVLIGANFDTGTRRLNEYAVERV